MPTSSTGSQRYTSGPNGCIHGQSPTLTSSQKSSFEERCVHPLGDWTEDKEVRADRKARLQDADGKETETIGFIPGSAEPSTGVQTCNPCVSPRGCRTFVCGVLTCGLYRVCQRTILAPCLSPGESSPDEPEKVSLRAVTTRGEEGGEEEENGGAAWLEDLHIGGVRVDSQGEDLDVITKVPSYAAHTPTGLKQHNRLSFYDSLNFDDWEDGDEDVDSLIAKKLLELYSEYQIDELARCTSDSVFVRRSKEINQLINSLAEEHKMGEQEAECRLVRGIIRISTRKSKKKGPRYTRTERTLSDSGNETMRDSDSFSFSNNNDYKSNPNIQISEITDSDMYARKMRKGSNGGRLPSHTVSSGVSLLRTSVRT